MSAPNKSALPTKCAVQNWPESRGLLRCSPVRWVRPAVLPAHACATSPAQPRLSMLPASSPASARTFSTRCRRVSNAVNTRLFTASICCPTASRRAIPCSLRVLGCPPTTTRWKRPSVVAILSRVRRINRQPYRVPCKSHSIPWKTTPTTDAKSFRSLTASKAFFLAAA